jgi:hypothetical protein
MMLVCSKCKTVMRCKMNGLGIRFREAHVYPGDEFECSECGATVILTTREPIFDPDRIVNTIQMN